MLLYRCLRTMFERSDFFGGSLFALAASVVTDLLHHEPLSYRTLEEVGLPKAFVAAIKVRALAPAGPSGTHTQVVCAQARVLVWVCKRVFRYLGQM